MSTGRSTPVSYHAPVPIEPAASATGPPILKANLLPSSGLQPSRTSAGLFEPISAGPSTMQSKEASALPMTTEQKGKMPARTDTLTKPRPDWLPIDEPLTTIATGQVVPALWVNTDWDGLKLSVVPTYQRGLGIEDNCLLDDPLVFETRDDYIERQLPLRGWSRENNIDKERLADQFYAWAEDKGTKCEQNWLTLIERKNVRDRVRYRERDSARVQHFDI